MTEEKSYIVETDLSLRKILSNNIRQKRKELHLTQERLAENADISLPYLSDIEHCKTWVSDKTLLKLSKALFVTPSDLLQEDIVQKENSEERQIANLLQKQKKLLNEAINKICDETFKDLMK